MKKFKNALRACMASLLAVIIMAGTAMATENVIGYKWNGSIDDWKITETCSSGSDTTNDWEFKAENGVLKAGNTSWKHVTSAESVNSYDLSENVMTFHLNSNLREATKNYQNSVFFCVKRRNAGEAFDHWASRYYKLTLGHDNTNRVLTLSAHDNNNTTPTLASYKFTDSKWTNVAFEYDMEIKVKKETGKNIITVSTVAEDGTKTVLINAEHTTPIAVNGPVVFYAQGNVGMEISNVAVTDLL